MEFAAGSPPHSFANCTNISDQNVRNLALARGITGLLCFVLCVLTLIIELVLACWRRKFRTILHRLFIYLTVSTVAYLFVLSLHIEHYFQYPHQHNFCIAVGFLDQYTGSVQLCFTLGVTAFLFYKAFSGCQGRIKLPCVEKRCCNLWLELLFVVLSFLTPLAFDWIPFVLVPYGETGPWCWIESLVSKCKLSNQAFLEQMMLWYVPFGVVAFCSFLLILAMITVFVWMRYHEMIRVRINGIIKEQCLLLGFLVVFCILWLTEVVTRLILYHNESAYGLWVIYAISTPLSGVIIPVGFISYLPCKLYCKNHKKGKELDGTVEGKNVQVPDPSSVTTKNCVITSSDGQHSEAKQKKCVITSSNGQHSEAKQKKCVITSSNGQHSEAKQKKRVITSSDGQHSEAKQKKCVITSSDGQHSEAKQKKRVITSSDGQHSEKQTKESMEVQPSETQPLLGQRGGHTYASMWLPI